MMSSVERLIELEKKIATHEQKVINGLYPFRLLPNGKLLAQRYTEFGDEVVELDPKEDPTWHTLSHERF
jgi:hypothetical protein